MTKSTASILMLIEQERKRQTEKWGSQNHSAEKWMTVLSEEVGEVAKEINDRNDGEEYVNELIQVAAVAVAMIECYENGSA